MQTNETWRQIPPDELHSRFMISSEVSKSLKTQFYTNCSSKQDVPNDVECEVFGFVEHNEESDFSRFYSDLFSLADLFEFYEEEVLSDSFNWLDMMHNHLTLYKKSGKDILPVLTQYAEKMKNEKQWECEWSPLDSADVSSYGFRPSARVVREYFQLRFTDTVDKEFSNLLTVAMFVFNSPKANSVLGLHLAQFSKKDLNSNLRTPFHIKGRGVLLTQCALKGLIRLLRKNIDTLQ